MIVSPGVGRKLVHAMGWEATAVGGSSSQAECGIQNCAAVQDVSTSLDRLGRRALSGPACMIAGGNIHAVGARVSNRAGRMCPRQKQLARGKCLHFRGSMMHPRRCSRADIRYLYAHYWGGPLRMLGMSAVIPRR